ncbi:aquaporin Z [Pseudoxanthomonas helianthi]|uniref:Aquaporin Z n=1 Tax=Pseudoxanthomonas helianthi TaxID=1453541 RepID=A0A941AV15_9GAMM|nr:aquaporin Z [Pseudoxanthomonas helianthi]MBP3985904.1 aquaporin Z [Pseudoxanthomonas helianthi]
MALGKKLAAEFLGTFWLVLGGCGSAVLAAKFGGDGNPLGIGLLGVALAFGLTVLTGAYAFGHISGGHFNPAVSFGLWAGGRFSGKELLPYIVAQVLGAIAAAFILYHIASGAAGFAIDPTAAGAFATNGYDALSPGGYSAAAAFLCEVVLTAFFLIVIMGSTHRNAPAGFAPIAIGLALTLIHLISIPVTNTSVNPARSTGVALVVGNGAVSQLWLFWVAPILGGLIGGIAYKWLGRDD